MVKNSTRSQFIEKNGNITDHDHDSESLNIEFHDVQKVIEDKQIKAPQKSVDFILNFSKAFKTKKLKNGDYTEMLIN
jgi:hypothetical protein